MLAYLKIHQDTAPRACELRVLVSARKVRMCYMNSLSEFRLLCLGAPNLRPAGGLACGAVNSLSARRLCPPNPPQSLSRPASQVRFATFLAVHCLRVCCNSHTCLKFVSMRRRIMLAYLRIRQGTAPRACTRRELVRVRKLCMHDMNFLSGFCLL